jgi:hypothetical protein
VPASGSKYQSDQQPRLTVVLQTRALDEQPPLNAFFQTTVVSRLYAR